MAGPKLTLQCTFDKLAQQLDITPVPQTPTDVHFHERGASALTGMLPPKLLCRPYIRKGTFDLLALPPELRNDIYQQVLMHDLSSGHIPNTALLRTCKQIHDEARLLPEMHGVVRLDITTDNQGTLSVDGNVASGQRTFGRLSPLIDFAGIWPAHLHRLPTVIINIKIDDSSDNDTPSVLYRQTFTAVNRLLFSLACHLKSKGNLSRKVAKVIKRNMTINIKSSCLLDESRAKVSEELFYPLAKMPHSYNIKIAKNSILACVEDSLIALREHHNRLGSTTAPEVYFNLIQQWLNKYDSFTLALDLEADGQPRPPRLRIFLTQPQRTSVLGSIRTYGRSIFTGLQLGIEHGAMNFSQRTDNRLYGMLATVNHVSRTIHRQQEFTTEEMRERLHEASEMFGKLVANKSPL